MLLQNSILLSYPNMKKFIPENVSLALGKSTMFIINIHKYVIQLFEV